MPSTIPEAFAAVFERLSPGPETLVDDRTRATVLEAFKDVRAAAHPSRIHEARGVDPAGRGLLAHALFLSWDDRREAEYLLERAREHMLRQLREGQTPLPHVYALAEALTRLVAAWSGSEREQGT